MPPNGLLCLNWCKPGRVPAMRGFVGPILLACVADRTTALLSCGCLLVLPILEKCVISIELSEERMSSGFSHSTVFCFSRVNVCFGRIKSGWADLSLSDMVSIGRMSFCDLGFLASTSWI